MEEGVGIVPGQFVGAVNDEEQRPAALLLQQCVGMRDQCVEVQQQLQKAVSHLSPQFFAVAGAAAHFGRDSGQQAGQEGDAAPGFDLGLDFAFDVLEALVFDDARLKPINHRFDKNRVWP